MTITELIVKIKESSLSESTKGSILVLLEGQTELTADLDRQVKDLIQAEIDADFKAVGVDDSVLGVQEEYQKMDQGLASIEADFAQDMQLVEEQVAKLDEIQKKVVQAEEQAQIEALRASLQ